MKRSLIKLFVLNLLFLLVCIFSRCISEDTNSCPTDKQNNLILKFVYTDNRKNDLFMDYIHQVEVFIFNNQEYLVRRQTIDKTALSVFSGTKLNLAPGKYRIVCWGNTMNRSKFDGIDIGSNFTNAFVRNSSLQNNAATNGDPLFYAPLESQKFIVTIPPKGAINETISFCCAHIKIEIYIKGFEYLSPLGSTLTPLVELTNISAEYNFDMKSCCSNISNIDAASYRIIEGQQLAVINFYTPIFTEDTPSKIFIKKQSDGSILTTISLKEFIKQNNIKLISSHQTVIPILVEYKSTTVNITLPGWRQNPTEPEL